VLCARAACVQDTGLSASAGSVAGMGSDLDQDLMLFISVLALAALTCAAVYLVVWMVRGTMEDSRARARTNRIRDERMFNEAKAHRELQNDLLDLGFTHRDLVEHRTVSTGQYGVEYAEYEFPRDQFVQHVRRAAQLHSQVIEAFGRRGASPR
jgi:hypothetical protein